MIYFILKIRGFRGLFIHRSGPILGYSHAHTRIFMGCLASIAMMVLLGCGKKTDPMPVGVSAEAIQNVRKTPGLERGSPPALKASSVRKVYLYPKD